MSTTKTASEWTRVCAVTEIAVGEATVLEVIPPVSVFNVDGSFYAIDDTCTHEIFSLADGFIEGPYVECALHMAKFDLRTGEALCAPATVGVRTYPVKTEDEQIFVDLSSRG